MIAVAVSLFILTPVHAKERLVGTPIPVAGAPVFSDLQPVSDGGYIASGGYALQGLDGVAFVMKLDSNGVEKWRKEFKGSGLPHIPYIRETKTGSFMFAGSKDDKLFFGEIKKDGSEVVWEKGDIANGRAMAIVEGGAGEFLIGGYTYDGPLDQVVLVRRDRNGQFHSKIVPSQKSLTLFSGIPGIDGGMVLVGSSDDKGYMLKVNQELDIEWEKTFSTTNEKTGQQEYGYYKLNAITYTPQKDRYVIAGHVGVQQGGTRQYMLFVMTDANGNMMLISSFADYGHQIGRAITATRDGGYLIAGGNQFEHAALLKINYFGFVQWDKKMDNVGSFRSALQLADGSYLLSSGWGSAALYDLRVGEPQAVSVDDAANRIIGLNEKMEYSTDGGQTYKEYWTWEKEPVFPGDQSVLVRYKRESAAGFEAGPPKEVQFTANPVIETVSALSDLPVAYGTSLAEAGLPPEVEVTLSGGAKVRAAVTWDGGSPAYDASRAGTYTFTGTLTPPSGTANPAGVTATVRVIVGAAPIEAVSALTDLPVAYGTPLAEAGLPPEVEVTLSGGAKTRAAVTWDGGSPAYDASRAGTYTFTGTLTPPSGTANPASVTAKVRVIVGAAPIETVSALTDLPVAYGTALAEAGLPPEVEVTLSGGAKVRAAVTWDGGSPAYDASRAGTYTFTGTLTPPSGTANPSSVTAKVRVIVGAAPIEAVSALTDLPVAYGTALAEAGLPPEVEVTLSGGAKVRAAVTWDGGSPAYDASRAGTYTFTGTLTPPSGTANPSSVTAKVRVIVSEQAAYLTDVEVDPVSYRLNVGDSRPTVVKAVYSDGTRRTIADESLLQFTSTAPAIAEVSLDGIVKGRASGSATVTVQYQVYEADFEVFVIAVTPPPVDTGSDDEDEEYQPLPSNPNLSTTICGEASCTASFGDAVRIEIPAQGESFTITIEKVTVSDQIKPDSMTMMSSVHELLKNTGRTFVSPVTLRFAFDPADVEAGQRPALFFYDEDTSKWVEVEGYAEGKYYYAKVDHFTKFALFQVKEEAPASEQPNATPAPTPVPVELFSDVNGHWAEISIQEAAAKGIASGHANGLFLPDQPITRMEFTVMLMRALGEAESVPADRAAFTDAEVIPEWALPYIAAAADRQIVSGYSDGSFRPNVQVTRAEMAVMLDRALKVNDQQAEANAASPSFVDEDRIPEWAKSAVTAVYQYNLVQGRSGNVFAPDALTTRAEAVVVLLRMFGN
ncbi:Ig-like domain-containing protein [Paenibacillus turpanensis]|uniref:Ig-like domain-containing protein n=1 Tax=Paenibacillus turpanensis TaxID=2689078 RepID=UPI00140AF085|nr:Ig-like domain-containing protein [Paenibacillus turpanensis]